MDIASTLLTKKAALIGGGAAATTTAVTVPIVVSQSKEETPSSGSPSATRNKREAPNEGGESPTPDENGNGASQASQQQEIPDPMEGEIVIPTLDDLADLDLTGEDFYENFNKPGYCLKKLFPGIERSIFFKPKGELKPASVTASEIFKTGNITGGCYTINKEVANNGKQRIELIAKSDTEGWLWMTGLKQEGDHLKLWYKEAHLRNEEGTWKVVVGQEGEIPKENGYSPTLPNLEGEKSKFKTFKKVDPKTKKECNGQASEDCKTHMSRVGYWTNTSPSTDQFMTIEHGSSGNHITRWSFHKTHIWKKEYRKRIFLNGKWHSDTTAEKEEERKLIHVDDSKVPTKTGSWKDLIALCGGTESSDSPYTTYCKKAS